MTLDRLLKAGQLLALVVVPIWVISQLVAANAVMTSRIDSIAQVQQATLGQLVTLSAQVHANSRAIARLQGKYDWEGPREEYPE